MSYVSYVKARGLGRPSEALALDLINYFNQTTLDTFDFSYGRTGVVDQRPEILDDQDTFVPVVVDLSQDSHYTPHNDFRQDGFLYKRLSIEELVAGRALSVIAPAPTYTTWDLLGQLNHQLQSQLSHRDVVDAHHSATDAQVLVRIAADSLAWTGEFAVNVDQTPVTVVIRKTLGGQLRATTEGFTRSVV